MKRYFSSSLFILLISVSASSFAQFGADYKKAGDMFFAKGDYYSAAQYYEKFLGVKGKTSSGSYKPYFMTSKKASGMAKKASGSQQEAIYKLAESYRLYNDYTDAEKWYGESVNQNATAYPLSRYWYGVSLRANNKLDSAKTQLVQFSSEYKGDQAYLDKAKRETDNITFIQQQMNRKDLKYYVVTKKESDWNAPGANYAPTLADAQTLVFTSTRDNDGVPASAVHTNYLYQVGLNNNSKAQKISLPVVSTMQSGVASFSADGNTMYFTEWTKENGKSLSSIYSSQKTNGNWSEPVMLGSNVNMPGFSSQQPFITPGALLFSSDRTGGQGGYDLWSAPLGSDGQFGPATNLGPLVNTKDDEEAPYYSSATKTLVFSSNGMVGMGGFDLYQSKGDINNLSTPVNLGYPVNSIKDDIYFTSLDKDNLMSNALFSSDRSSLCCLELFSLNKLKQKRMITGKVVNCKDGSVLPGATVSVEDTINNRTITSFNTDATGNYSFTVDDYQPLKLHATLNGYNEGNIHIYQPSDQESESMMNADLCMIPIPPPPVTEAPPPVPVENKPFILKNVYFEFNKSKLMPSSYRDLDSVVTVLKNNPDQSLDIAGYTDAKGSESYNLELSAARAKSCLVYIKKKGIPEARLHTKAFGKCCPVVPDTNPDGSDNPENRAQNRRTEFKLLK